MIKRYKEIVSFDERRAESLRLITKYPDKIPVICEYMGSNILESIASCTQTGGEFLKTIQSFQPVDKRWGYVLSPAKMLVPSNKNFGVVLMELRRRFAIPPHSTLFTLINNKITPNFSSTMFFLYITYKDEDGFLYVYFGEENVFGAVP